MQSHLQPVADLLDRVEEQVKARPNSVCVECDGRQLTYRELNSQIDSIACRLRPLGAKSGVLIAIYLQRSVDLVAAILGVLKSGAAYLPIDPAIPEKRLEFLLADSGAAFAITEESLKTRLGIRTAYLIEDLQAAALSGSSNVNEQMYSGDDLAYVIYTSGSTGNPKGVEVCRRAFAMTVEAVRAQLEVTNRDVILAVTSQSFDVSSLELFLALTSGARLVLLPGGHAMQAEVLKAALEKSSATLMFGTPALWRLLLDSGWPGGSEFRAVIGGEALESNLAADLLQRTKQLWNHYGPTETTICATTFLVKPEAAPIPIGRALPQVRTFVLDAERVAVEPGRTGELYLGGESLARGYRNRPELTASRFVFISDRNGCRERVYRTGDLVRERADGNLEFLGRVDNQVKIRGYRVELEEIESAMSDHPDLAEAAAVLNQDENGDKTLVAYYRSKGNRDIRREELRNLLAVRLPSYMVPAHFIRLDRLPLSVTGKLDRVELSERPLPVGRKIAPPESNNPIEIELLKIWQRVLKQPVIGPLDNFFEIGGHSILAARLFGQIAEQFGKTLPLSTLFEAPTVELLAKVISQEADVIWSPLVAIRTAGSGQPFFCVHPIGGNVLIFKDLSEFMPAHPFYALQARGLNGREHPHTSIEAMAADYLNDVRRIQPHGPYFLGGYSAGGLVAFEMARLLREQQEEVSMVALFDTYLHPYSMSAVAEHIRKPQMTRASSGLKRRFAQFAAVEKEKRLALLGRDFARIWSGIKLTIYGVTQKIGIGKFRLDAVTAFLLALRNYRPKPLDVKAVLILADRDAPPSAEGLDQIWQILIPADLKISHVAADHDELIRNPFAKDVAVSIEEQLQARPGSLEARSARSENEVTATR